MGSVTVWPGHMGFPKKKDDDVRSMSSWAVQCNESDMLGQMPLAGVSSQCCLVSGG